MLSNLINNASKNITLYIDMHKPLNENNVDDGSDDDDVDLDIDNEEESIEDEEESIEGEEGVENEMMK